MRRAVGLSLLFLLPCPTRADESYPLPHPLPPPHGSIVLPLAPNGTGLPPGSSVPLPGPLPPGVKVVVVPPGFYRPDPYAAWQAVSPDAFGRFRPRVLINADGELFYAADGRPYGFYPSSKSYHVRP